jgi:hypothetical protein
MGHNSDFRRETENSNEIQLYKVRGGNQSSFRVLIEQEEDIRTGEPIVCRNPS